MAAITPTAAQAGVLEKLFAPKAKIWPVWEQHDPNSKKTIEHDTWDSFLKSYVKQGANGVNLVDYAGVSDADRTLLKSYIGEMQDLPISSYSRPEQLAFWINLYNAVTVDVVLDHYPVESIRDIRLTKGLFSKGPWNKKLLVVEENELSLNDIEHRILRPIWQDPRIHYAVNCASVGCPNLMTDPFTPDNSDQLLQEGARDYVNHQRGARINNGRLHVSSIYVWFESDFGGSEAGVIDHLKRHAAPALSVQLDGIGKISDDSYDWSLNDAGG